MQVLHISCSAPNFCFRILAAAEPFIGEQRRRPEIRVSSFKILGIDEFRGAFGGLPKGAITPYGALDSKHIPNKELADVRSALPCRILPV